ncbi:MAG: 2-C-methyl-D-erythritol 4-phosphate cytidylyltransferase [Tannerella sp.]|jgi:2-C-methyl-D-erythritol 4-phosphate cytidylyltransferase|nr:2-C-methyl-D-erythritol 4-phosphate cytidylyltransferase [Tannerella sp.]
MKNTVIIVAGGKGLRMGSDLPKQFIPLQGRPVLMHTLGVFYQWDSAADLLLVIPEEHESYWKMLCRELDFTIPHRMVYAGETRFHSVRNGLRKAGEEGLIAVHDGVRPFVSYDVISSCFTIAEAFGAAIPVIPMIESVREVNGGESRPFDRNRLCIVQTPQVFRANLLHRAYEQSYDDIFTDDASLVEASGHTIRLVDGNRENIKITTPMDLQYAKIILENR